MALRSALNVKQVVGATDLSLTALPGTSLLVTDIYVFTPATAQAKLQTDKTTVGAFRVSGTQGNHLFVPKASTPFENMLTRLRINKLFSGYPVPEGSTFLITGVNQAAAVQAVVYSVYDAADFKPDAVNGPLAKTFEYMNYGRYSTTLAAGDNLYGVSNSPVEFPGFPFGELAPAGQKMTLLAIFFSDVGKSSSSAANKQYTSFLKFIQDRQVLFDIDRNGLAMRGQAPASDGTQVAYGPSVLNGASDVDQGDGLYLPVPIVFSGGSELDVYVTTVVSAGSANLAVADAEVALWFRVAPQ
jgi:hypothetical protein